MPAAKAGSVTVALAPAETEAAGDKTTPAPQPVAKAKRRKPGRPKAGRLDVPRPVGTDSGPEMAAPTTPVAVKPAPAATARIHRTKPAGGPRRLNDLAPAPAVQAAPAVAPTPTHHPAAPVYAGVVAASWTGRFRTGALGWSLLPAALLAIVCAAITFALMRQGPAQFWTATQRAGWAVGGELVLVALLYYASRNVAAAAIAFGAARQADHRQSRHRHQLRVAINSFWSRVGLDAFVVTLQLIVASLMAILVMVGGVRWPMPELAQLAVLFIAFLALTYALAGLGLIQGLARVGLTLGSVSVWRAFGLGWSFFQRHFELVGYKALAVLFELLLILPLAGVVIALVVLLPADLKWLAPIGVLVLTLTAGTLIGAGAAVWWQAAYSRLVRRYRNNEAAKLLGGRSSSQLHQGAAVMTALVGLLLVGATIAWPWLSGA
jgi:hypothetical protein